MNRYHPEERIREALIERFLLLKETTLPELWRVEFPICLRSVARMEHRTLQAWFCGFTPARKLGMWWTLQDDGDGNAFVTLHGTCGEKPVVDTLSELIMWISAESEETVEPGKVSGNITLLTTATEPYSY